MKRIIKKRIKIAGFIVGSTALLTILKVTGIVAWSWAVVLAPIWLPIILFVIALMSVLSPGHNITRRRW